jgi:hypothetical protein
MIEWDDFIIFEMSCRGQPLGYKLAFLDSLTLFVTDAHTRTFTLPRYADDERIKIVISKVNLHLYWFKLIRNGIHSWGDILRE